MNSLISENISAPWWISIWPLLNMLIMCIVLILGIYGFVLFVKFAKLGIKAFSIYIEKNKR